jgi:hypothetical protein
MAQGSSTVPPPPSGDPNVDVQAPGNGGGMDKFRSIISRLSGGGTPAIDKALAAHHDQVMADAKRHADSAKQYYKMVAQARATGKNPVTGQPVTPQELAQWQQQADGAWADYTKIAGKSKAAKPIIEKMGGMLKHIAGGGQQAGQQGAQTVPPPPQGAAPPSPQSGTVPPPPTEGSTAASTAPNPLQESATNEFNAESMKSQTAITEAGGKAKAEETAKVEGLRDSLKAAGFSDEEIKKTLTAKFGGKPHITTKMEPDASSPTGFSWVSKDAISGEEYSRESNALPTRSLTPSDTDTTTTDPFGNVSHSHSERKPQVRGLPSQTGVAAPTGGTTTKKPSSGGSSSKPSAPVQPSAPSHTPTLDADGHIPAGSANPQVSEAANQLLDGSDKDKLPMKVREPAAALARRYGWEQGKFTPKEQVMLREATTFLQQAANDDSLSALDAGFADRMQLAQVLANPDKEGMVGRGLSTAAAQNMDPKQAKFVQLYNQLVGTISGMAQLVRSGRATEATIERLKSELPNPVTTKDSKDARQRIQRLLKEIDVAMAKGSFEGNVKGGRPSTVPPPPTGKTIYAKDPSGTLHKATEGTPLPQGWKLTDAPAASQ